MPLVSVEEYLNTSYEYDPDFVDGVLVERGQPTIPHSLLQVIVATHFAAWQKEFAFRVLTSARVRIIAGARYRVPDVLLCPAPLTHRRYVEVTPVAVIDILSPDDKESSALERCRDFEYTGVANIVQMDPEKRVAHRFTAGSLIETQFENLSNIPFDSEALFEQLRNELAG